MEPVLLSGSYESVYVQKTVGVRHTIYCAHTPTPLTLSLSLQLNYVIALITQVVFNCSLNILHFVRCVILDRS